MIAHKYLSDVKQNFDRYLANGVNHIVYHGSPYSPENAEWPGWLFYASVHFAPTNSLWTDLKSINEYVGTCQSFLQTSTPNNDVLLYFPIYDRWSDKGRALLHHFAGGATGTPARLPTAWPAAILASTSSAFARACSLKVLI